MTSMRPPTEEEVLSYFARLSNKGRWGKEDQLGTLNLITPDKRVRAARLVQEGAAFSLCRLLDPRDPDDLERGSVLQRYMLTTSEGLARLGRKRLESTREWIGITPHGSSTHLDALSHMAWDGALYNGYPARAVNVVDGAGALSVHSIVVGVTTRGVLLDVAALRGVPWLDPGEAAFPEDLEAAERRQGVRVESGDALLLYTGNLRRKAEKGLAPHNRWSGYSSACLPWLRERDVALISSDGINDVQPSGYSSPDLMDPVHAVSIVALGLPLVDNMELDELAIQCADRKRWEFLFTMNTWRLVGSSSSPVNPVAIF